MLERSVLPSVIARGARAAGRGVEDGVAILEATGSPGAVLPLASRIEALVRAAVPEITARADSRPRSRAAAGGAAGASPSGPAASSTPRSTR